MKHPIFQELDDMLMAIGKRIDAIVIKPHIDPFIENRKLCEQTHKETKETEKCNILV